MTQTSKPAPFKNSGEAAMRVLTSGADLNQREGQFLGGIAFADRPLTEKQLNWLRILLSRHGLPPLVEGGRHD